MVGGSVATRGVETRYVRFSVWFKDDLPILVTI